jgi:hypothetical protein
LITPSTFGEGYRLRNSSLCSLLHPSAISCLLGPNISAPCFQTHSIYVLSVVRQTKFTSIQNNR